MPSIRNRPGPGDGPLPSPWAPGGARTRFPRQPPRTQPGLRRPRRSRQRWGGVLPAGAARPTWPGLRALCPAARRGPDDSNSPGPGSASPAPSSQPSPSRGFPLRLLATSRSGKEEEGAREGRGEGPQLGEETRRERRPRRPPAGLSRKEEREGRGQRKKEATEPPCPAPGPAPLPSHHRRPRSALGPGVQGEGSGLGALPAPRAGRGGTAGGEAGAAAGQRGPASVGECPAGPARLLAKGDPREEGRRPGGLGAGHCARRATAAPPPGILRRALRAAPGNLGGQFWATQER